MKRKLYLLVICFLLLTSLMLISCGKATTNSITSTTKSKTSSYASSTTNSLSNPVTIDVTATITVSKYPSGLAYNPSANEIFVIDGGRGIPASVISDTQYTVAPSDFFG